MAMKVYPPEFKADAVALYLSDPARTYASVAKDLGVNRETLRLWVRQARSVGSAAGDGGPVKKAPTSADNAAAEAFNATLKRETLQGAKRWGSARQARLAVFAWITRYNTRRRHSSLNYLSPINYEQQTDKVLLAA